MNAPVLQVEQLSKSFTLHHQGGVQIPVFERINFSVQAGECLVLQGQSGRGKSTLLRCLYGNYKLDSGAIVLRHESESWRLDQVSARQMIYLRREKIAHVSQFLRVIPRVAAFDVVQQPLLAAGVTADEARRRCADLLSRLNIPERLWALSPTTFSGGEQQRINIAREMILARPLILLDEPTASLDAANRATVLELIGESKAQGCAVIGVFHDQASRDQVADHIFEIPRANNT